MSYTLEDFATVRGFASDQCKIRLEFDPLWGFTMVIDDEAYPLWQRTTSRVEDVITLTLYELEDRYSPSFD